MRRLWDRQAGPLAVALHRIIFAQGMAFPVLRHHDPLQVGMSQEVNPKQIEKLALKKIGGWPHRSYGFDHRILAIERDFQSDPFFALMREQVISQLETWIAGKIIGARQIGKKVD